MDRIDRLNKELTMYINEVSDLETELMASAKPKKADMIRAQELREIILGIRNDIDSIFTAEMETPKGRVFNQLVARFAQLRRYGFEKAHDQFRYYYLDAFEEIYDNGITDPDSVWMLLLKRMS